MVVSGNLHGKHDTLAHGTVVFTIHHFKIIIIND
jgi:hypothetical protein